MTRFSLRSAPVLVGLTFALLGARSARAEDKAPPKYACDGFDDPLRHSPVHIARGRVLPLRAKLALPNGTYGDNTVLKTPPMVSLVYQPESGPEVDKTATIEVRDYGKGTHFVWDPEAHWKFDLGTLSIKDNGKYKVTLLSGDEKEYLVDPTCTVTFLLE